MTPQVVDKIHQFAYWRVIIRPTEFDPQRIASLGKCKELVEASRVGLRYGEYPCLGEMAPGTDWIDCTCDSQFEPQYEYWRLYQSGQFVHHFACLEEFHKLPWTSYPTPAPERYLLVSSVIHGMTVILEFAARLASRDVMRPSIQVVIQLHRMGDRKLTTWHGSVGVRGLVSKIDSIPYTNVISQGELIRRAPEVAIEAAIAVFERFGWLNPPRDWLAEEQRKLLERRLGS